ncbi:MAG: bifunctional adenosylcobinamide kinase/adenosylcobinamide-phosphate guanylyltransferase [Cellvibrionaceae bacterium]|nr:bifunctional adenosylcobinamide kinase/adenosylcobinamide-phosphate guanylyltransferase [Cellvibrionaceae bacterium]
MQHLILGGVRSGKSRYGQQLAQAAEQRGLAIYYIATAERQLNDDSMAERIRLHQQSRPSHWQLLESPLTLGQTIAQYAAPERCLLVDCLTLWLSNCLLSQRPQCWAEQRQQLFDSLAAAGGDIILVSNEVGQGVVPMAELSRHFVDQAGALHQQLAQQCQRVSFVTAGIAQSLKG